MITKVYNALPEKLTFVWKPGLSRVFELLVNDEENKPFSFENYTAKLQIKESKNSNIVFHTFSTEANNLILEEGKITFFFEEEELTNPLWKIGVYDFVIKTPNNETQCWFEGFFSLKTI